MSTWLRDNLGRVSEERNDSRFFVYNARDELTKRTDRNGPVRKFDHDALGRLTEERWLDASQAVIERLDKGDILVFWLPASHRSGSPERAN